MEDLVSSSVAARRAGVAPCTLLRAVRRGDLHPALRTPSGRCRFHPADVDAYARRARQRQVPAAAATPAGSLLAGFSRLAALPTDLAPGRLIEDVLAIVAECLNARAALLIRAEGVTLRSDRALDRDRLGLSAGMDLAAAPATGAQPCAAGATRDDQCPAPVAAARPREQGACAEAPLNYADGRPYGALYVALRESRAASGEEMALLAIAGRTIMHALDRIEAHLCEERLAQEAAARAAEFATVLEHLPCGVVVVDTEGHVTFMNERGRQIAGSAPDLTQPLAAQAGAYALRQLDGEDAGAYTVPARTPIARALVGERVASCLALVRLPGSTTDRMLEAAAVPLCDAVGAPRGAVGIFSDVTERMRNDEALRASEARFTSLYEHAPIGVALLDVQGHPVMTNKALQHMLGYDEDELRSMSFTEFTHPDDLAADWVLYQELLSGKRESYTLDKRYIHKDGRVVWGHLAVSATRDRDGAFQSIVGMLLDLTASRAAHEELKASEERYRRIVETTHDGIWQTDVQGRTTYVNARMAALLGCTVEEMQGVPIFAFMDEEGRAMVQESLRRRTHDARQGQDLDTHFDFRFRRTDGSTLWALVSTHAIISAGTYIGTWALVTDITERKRAEEELRHQALHDVLTDLPNRQLLQDRMEHAIRAAQGNGHPLALLLLDLDRFKDVNDTFGHHYGDLLLQQAARRLRGTLRASDTVARLGGDEFAVLLPNDNAAGALIAAWKIHAALDAPFIIDGHTVQAGGSIGIALYPDHGTDGQTLLRRADVAMYVAKRSGEVYAVYSEDQDRYTPERLALTADLRQAIAAGELVLHYQPTVDLATGRAHAVEALVRWAHPAHGLLGPGQFIPLAEESGLIGPLTHWVMETALDQCRRWQQAGVSLSVAVNLSTVTLHDPQLPELIAYLLRAQDLAPSCLRIEVTESVLMDDLRQTQEVLCQIAALGVRISVDDYGTGYSSLAYLKRLPVDELKIDMSFVRHLREDKADAAIVASTIDLGHHLGLRVVAEGVEDRQTQERLAAMRCDAAQGYYWSRPLPAEEVLKRLRDLTGAPA